MFKRESGLILCVVGIILSGCAASGVKVSEQQAQNFQVNKSTYSEVVASLGQPTQTSVDSAGIRIATYSYSSMSSRPENFIPYIGPFVGGYDQKTASVTFTFDSRGLLKNTTSSQGNLGTGRMLSAPQ